MAAQDHDQRASRPARSGLQPARGPRRRRFLAVPIAVVVLLAAWAVVQKTGRLTRPEGPRSVLFITMDTTRADYLGCYGRTTAQTPHIDRLAREGTLFTRCTTCSPLTLPSHASMMTAVYPYVHGARQNGTGRLAESNETLAETLKAAGFATQATVASFVLNRQFGIAQGFDVYHDVVRPATGDPSSAERRGDEVCDDALAMLRDLAGQRFFLWVHFYDPHFPYLSPRISDILSPLAYADEITFMDAQIGRLMDGLRELNLERDTLVIAVADHGEGLNDHDEWKHGYFLYETTLRTPLIMRCPGIVPAGKTIAAEVRTIDLAPTILEWLDLPPWDHAQGVSLVGLVTGQSSDPGLAAYAETFQAQVEYGLAQLRSLTAGGWKYVWTTRPELYQLTHDPDERRDLAVQEPQRAAEMLAQLRQLIADAPPPPAKEDSATTLTDEDRTRLASLGYVSGPSTQDEGDVELDRFEPRGGNPRDYALSFKLISWELPRLRHNRDYAAAEHMLRQLSEALPEAAYLHAHLAEILEAQGRADEAVQAFERAVALTPGDHVVRMKYGLFLRRADRAAEALAQFRVVLERWPDDAKALCQAALALAALNELDAAEEKLRRALALEPRNAMALRVMGLVCEQAGKLPEAIQYFDEALRVDPGLHECTVDRQRVAEKLGG